MKKPVSHIITALAAALTTVASQASAQAVADPAGSSPITGAVNWMRGTLFGGLATGIAVMAVAMVGIMMLTGRLNWRYGATVIVGVFILFGAATIVGGIQTMSGTAH